MLVCVPYALPGTLRSEKDNGSPWAWVTDGCSPSSGVLGAEHAQLPSRPSHYKDCFGKRICITVSFPPNFFIPPFFLCALETVSTT